METMEATTIINIEAIMTAKTENIATYQITLVRKSMKWSIILPEQFLPIMMIVSRELNNGKDSQTQMMTIKDSLTLV